ncbi:MAG: pyridoxal phosphate-dependent aminotransferase [Treponemataceae bacterium]|nr:pyridoxal phosphate-dependent aminotransferase [Treponemataceae bacterium]
MSIAEHIKKAQESGSWIRRMFEEGAALKKQFGADRVFDFSLGNPDVEPPVAFHETLVSLATEDAPGSHGYMPNAGFPEVRGALAHKVQREQGVPATAAHIVMSVGAAGGLNVVFKAILNPGDEVIVSRPYFVEYGAYIANHGGTMVLVSPTEDFDLDIGAIQAALTEKTAAVLINSPHNPTGRVYPAATIRRLAEILESHGRRTGRWPYLVADEPYREIVYGGIEVPPILSAYRESIVVTSYSKSLSLPGERIGYIALNPGMEQVEEVAAALAYTTRILGFVNAPALMQRIVARLTESRVEVGIYERRRDAFTAILEKAGITYVKPEGAFYLFCRVPSPKKGSSELSNHEFPIDVHFVQHLKKHLILAVPGSGFGAPGYIRLAYCVDENIIRRSEEAFLNAMGEW